MVKQASNVRKRLCGFLTADPGRFAGGSAVSDPLGLLATFPTSGPAQLSYS